VILCVWYGLGRYVRPIGDLYAILLTAVGKVGRAVAGWLQAFSIPTDPGRRPGLAAIVRLIALVFAVLVMVGEAYSSLVAAPALFGMDLGPVTVPFPGLAVPALAVLFFSLCSIFGICGLEAAGCLPAEARFFEVPPQRTGVFRWFSFGALGVSLIATALFYAERKFYLLNPTGDITTVMQILIFVMLGILVPCAALVAVWMVAVGIQTVVSLVLATVACIAAAVADVCEFLVRHFGGAPPLIHRHDARMEEGMVATVERPEGKPEQVGKDRPAFVPDTRPLRRAPFVESVWIRVDQSVGHTERDPVSLRKKGGAHENDANHSSGVGRRQYRCPCGRVVTSGPG
jgi:hypothetical protein